MMDQLVTFARHQARLDAPSKDGSTARAHLTVAAKRPGVNGEKARQRLQPPHFPTSLEYLWGWFCELAAARRYTDVGPVPLSFMDIDAWARLTDRHPEPREVAALLALDRVTLHPGEAT